MSQTTDYYQLVTSSSSTNHQRNKRLSSHQTFVSTLSAEPNTSASIVSTAQNDSPSSPSHTSPIVSDVCVSSQNGVRNASTTAKLKDNGNSIHDQYGFALNLAPSVAKLRKDPTLSVKSQFYPFDMTTTNEQDLHSPFELDVPLCEHHPLKRIQNDFLIDRMLKDEDNLQFSSQYRSPSQSTCSNPLNQPSPFTTPSSDHHDIDALSDAGTYVIDDDGDIARDDEPEPDIEQITEQVSLSSSSISSPFKRYVTTKRNRHGTFDIHSLSSTTTQTVNRPVVDLNTPKRDISSPSSASSSASTNSSSSSSLLSLPAESDNSSRKEPEGASHHTMDDKSSNSLVYTRQRPTTLLQHKRSITPPQNPIKPAECFVISPTFEMKTFPNTTTAGPRRKMEPPWKPKSITSVIPTKDSNVEFPSNKSPSSPPISVRSIQNDAGKYSFRLQQHTQNHDSKPQSSNPKSSTLNAENISLTKASLQHPNTIQDHTYLASPFQRNAAVRQTMPANAQSNRTQSSSTTTTKYIDDPDEMLSSHPSLTKVYMNKSFALRRQRSNLTPPTAKSIPQQQQQQQLIAKSLISRQLLKPTPTSVPSSSLMSSSMNNSSGQTNRAVELRRARAQAKIEELAHRTRQQLQKTEHHNDLMSTSWHSNASSTSKKDVSHLRANIRSTNSNVQSQKQDMSKTRTISSSSYHHRSSSASPNPLGDTGKTLRYRKAMVSSVTDEQQYQKMNGSTCSEGERCYSLRDDGQRLAIKLIQLSSGILAKLKPNNTAGDNDSNVRELEQLVDKLQTVNRTLSTIDAALTSPTSDDSLV